ncbi:MAG: hypothetical protein MK135_17450, partial [Polyangiaceae bacterium]|nr:hypothetical protein [Polyangiaceae bacterium]
MKGTVLVQLRDQGSFLRRLVINVCLISSFAYFLPACQQSAQRSTKAAAEHIDFLADLASQQQGLVQQGLPQGASLLQELFREAGAEEPDYQSAQRELRRARWSTPALQQAKTDFYVLTDATGKILRNNLEQDTMAGQALFQFYPALKGASKSPFAFGVGSMKDARGVKGRDDAQWMAASPIYLDKKLVGLVATGWSWSTFAERLESKLRAEVLEHLERGENLPLLYVYIVDHGQV